MPGPAPKDASLRARRNKSTTAAKLAAVPEREERPELPTRLDDEGNVVAWHAQTLNLWEEVWSSPMAAEYLDADVPGLHVLAALTDAYWKGLEQGRVGKDLAAEIRLQRQQYGLDPIARRRLQWEVERAEDAQERTQRRRRSTEPAPAPDPAADPRRLLAIVEEG